MPVSHLPATAATLARQLAKVPNVGTAHVVAVGHAFYRASVTLPNTGVVVHVGSTPDGWEANIYMADHATPDVAIGAPLNDRTIEVGPLKAAELVRYLQGYADASIDAGVHRR